MLNVPVMTIGIGVCLPFFISVAATRGRTHQTHRHVQASKVETLAASGFMDGEGVMGVGVIIAFIQVLTGKM